MSSSLGSPAAKYEHRAVHNVDLAGSVTGCQGCVSSDHDQLVASLLEHAQGGLALGLQGALQHGKTGKTEARLRLLASRVSQLGSCQVSGK